VKWENGEKKREGGVVSRARLSSLPRETKGGGEGDVNSPVSLGSCSYLYRDSQHCAGVVTCVRLLYCGNRHSTDR